MAKAPDKTVQFDRAKYTQLITSMNQICTDLAKWKSTDPSKSGLPVLNGNTPVSPGAAIWDIAKDLKTKIQGFTGSVFSMNESLLEEFRTFTKKLGDAVKVFEETDDLAQYDAEKFLSEFPDLVSASAGPAPKE